MREVEVEKERRRARDEEEVAEKVREEERMCL